MLDLLSAYLMIIGPILIRDMCRLASSLQAYKFYVHKLYAHHHPPVIGGSHAGPMLLCLLLLYRLM